MSGQQVLAAINALYTSDDSSTRNEADRWLDNWQASPEAWTVANQILHDPSSGAEYTYFCAQTLKTKVQRDFEELPADAVPQLRDSLMQLLFRFGTGSPAVRTQLCLAIAALAAHLPAGQWGGGGVLRWLMDKFSGQDPGMAMSCMLELLTVLPQEADSRKISCRPERRAEFKEELQDAIPDATSLLTSCLQQPGETVRSQVLESLGCWLKLSCGRHLPAGLPDSPLVAAALEGLKVDGTFHAAVDAVVEFIWITVDPQTCIPNPAMTGLAQHLVGQIMALRPRFSVALRKAIAEFEGRDGGNDNDVDDEFDDDAEAVKGMARLFCEVAEAYIQLILAATPQVLPPVEALLDVCAHPDHEISDMSFTFWHKLSRQLTAGSLHEQQQQLQTQQFPPPPGSPLAGGAQSQGDQMQAEQQRRREFFAPCFERLASLVRGRMRLPTSFNTMRSSERADWRRYRAAWGDVLQDACTALGCQRSLQILLQPLSEMVAPKPFDWQTAELALHCLRCISNLPFPHPEPLLEQLIAALPTLPSQEPQLHYTACLLLSAYAEWLGAETAVGRCLQLLPPLLNMLLAALGTPGSAQAAAGAIRDVCECCSRQMQSNLQQLLTLYTKTLEAGAASRAAAAAATVAASTGTMLHNPLMSPQQRQAAGAAAAAVGSAAAAVAGGLHEDDVQQVMQGVTTCVINCVPQEQLPAAIQTLAEPLLNPIKGAMQQFTPSLGAGGETTLAPQLPLFDRLATLFDSLPAQHAPAASILLHAWPALDVAMLRAGQDSAALERLCRVLRHGIKASNKSCANMLPVLLETLPGRFQQTGHPAFMYVVSELLKVFASEPAADTNMGHILVALLRGGCQKLTTLQEMDNAPDLMDDTFLLAGRAAAYAPRMLLHESLLPLLLDTAMLGVLVQHREACRSALCFLARLLDPGTALSKLRDQQQQRQTFAGTAIDTSAASMALLQSQLDRVGAQLTRVLMGAVVGALPYGRVADISPVVQAMLRLCQDKAVQWLRECMAAIPDVSLTAGDRDAFMTAAAAVLAGNAGMDGGCEGIEEALEVVSDLCRRNKRVSKAAQAALLPVQLHQVLGLV